MVWLKKLLTPAGTFDNFYIKLSEVVDLHVPVKQLSKQDVKAQSKPWTTSGIRTSIRIKNGLFKKFLKTKSTNYHAKFKIYTIKLNYLIKLAKRNYYNKFFSVHENNGKRIWYGIKQIIHVKTHVNQHVNKIVINNCGIVDQESIANVLNEFFANMGSNLASSIPSVTHTAREFMSPPGLQDPDASFGEEEWCRIYVSWKRCQCWVLFHLQCYQGKVLKYYYVTQLQSVPFGLQYK